MIFDNNASRIRDVMKAKGYAIFQNENGYDLNLFGIRTKDEEAETFNDIVGVLYLFRGVWNCFMFPATTDPGLYWRQNPMNVDGTAILVPNQYRGAYKLGDHKGLPALVQAKPLTVYRDNNKDAVIDDEGPVQTGYFGVNIHRASNTKPSETVGKWSAGCQVLQDPIQFRFLMSLCDAARARYGNSFTYTLLEEEDFE